MYVFSRVQYPYVDLLKNVSHVGRVFSSLFYNGRRVYGETLRKVSDERILLLIIKNHKIST